VTTELLIINQVINGICIAFYFAPAMGIALSRIKPQDIAAAAGLLSFCRTTGLAVSTSLATTEWQNAAIRSRAAIIDQYAETSGLQQFADQGFSYGESLRHLDYAVQDQAVMVATNNMYVIFAAAMVIGAVYIWLAPKMHQRKAGAAH
jgi:DHA2 family multidrug resistance protein